MIREVFECPLKHEDFKNGNIKVYHRTLNSKPIIEYWVYKNKPSNILNVIGRAFKTKEKELHCIIMCSDQSEHIEKKNNVGIFVNGVKIYKDSIETYLSKTNRK